MDNFGLKIEAFKQIFFEQNGYQKVIEGLQNTLIIAIAGLLIGIIIGILIATVRVVPKYKILPRILNGFCSFYVGFVSWNTDGSAAACLLLCITSDYWGKTYGRAGICACIWFE